MPEAPKFLEGISYTTTHRTVPFVLESGLLCDFLCVGGGGGNANNHPYYESGGGAGGMRCSGQAYQGRGGAAESAVKAVCGQGYPVVIGQGGPSNVAGSPFYDGSPSSVFGFTALGGAKGVYNQANGASGGSGSGAGGDGSGSYSGGSGTALNGYDGGGSYNNGGTTGAKAGGGGGGAGGNGGDNGDNGNQNHGGTGGLGFAWIDGLVYACGGAGGYGAYNSQPVGDNAANYPSGGRANAGNGGHYNSNDASAGARGQGGDGVTVIRYKGGTRATGGTISSAGGFTYHTFTTAGTFTPLFK